MEYLYCQNRSCGEYLGSLGSDRCHICGWCAGATPDDLLPIGTRIRFTKTLTSGPDEYSPGNLYANEGDGGEITGHDVREGYWVKWDKWPHPFSASRDEFEPVEQQESKG